MVLAVPGVNGPSSSAVRGAGRRKTTGLREAVGLSGSDLHDFNAHVLLPASCFLLERGWFVSWHLAFVSCRFVDAVR